MTAPPRQRTIAARASIRAWPPCIPVITRPGATTPRIRCAPPLIAGHEGDGQGHDRYGRVDHVDDRVGRHREQPEQGRTDEHGHEDHQVQDPKPSRASTCVLPLSPKAIHRASTPAPRCTTLWSASVGTRAPLAEPIELCPEEPEHADRDQDPTSADPQIGQYPSRPPSGRHILGRAGDTWWGLGWMKWRASACRMQGDARQVHERAVRGTEDAFAKLATVIRSAAAGDSGTLLIDGTAGVGTSRFIDEAIRRVSGLQEPMTEIARRGAWLCHRDAPYQPVIRALRPTLAALSDDDLGMSSARRPRSSSG